MLPAKASTAGMERVPSTPGVGTPHHRAGEPFGAPEASHDTHTHTPKAPPHPPPTARLRTVTYNVRVDHSDDFGTLHEWPLRRPLLASTLLSLEADVVALQGPSPVQARQLESDLGVEWGVSIAACDPRAWADAPQGGPTDAQARDGNGVAWRRERLELLETSMFWLSPRPDNPWRGAPAWGGSAYQRACLLACFRDRLTGQRVSVFSARFDHEGGDDLETVRTRHTERAQAHARHMHTG